MKKFILALVAMVTMTFTTASAMSYEQARQQALFLTDKMAYELNLTDDQYEAAYETNLDYLMSVNTVDDLYGIYWRQRNMDLSYILLDWQYRTFINATYFYRPLYWDAGYWHFGIYARYPHRDYFYFGRPHFYVSYCGGHSWRMNGGRSWYHGFNRGDFGRGQSFGNMNRNNGNSNRNNGQSFGNMSRGNDNRPQSVNRPQNNGGFGNQSSSFGNQNRQFGNRQSSTRTTVTRENPSNNSRPGGSFGGNRGGFGSGSSMMRSFGSGNTTSPSKSSTPRSNPGNGGASFGNSSRSFGGGNRSVGGPTRSNGGGSHGSFGGRR